ncbi:MAG: hypothetical protein PF630_08485 [Gammaproteobacteria bacterium]|jgi:flagellar motility protein MotE (MotC chaperone)|nr:hypothetical protein [Gammaproteobacteria bacterium]
MWSVFGWVLLGFAIWALMLIMHVVEKRYAPEWNASKRKAGRKQRRSKVWRSMSSWMDDDGSDQESEPTAGKLQLERELRELRERVQVLEAIVTDKRWQYEEELHKS